MNIDSILFDTNILVYNQDKESDFYTPSHIWHQKAVDKDINAYISHQNLIEFTAVMSNPKYISLPLTPKQIQKEIQAYIQHSAFTIISPNPSTMTHFQNLYREYPPKNPRHTFDLYLVATMLSHQITKILTLNTKDFTHIKEITVIPLKSRTTGQSEG
jgi:predicted nucleic acid-binding protein